jgi:hexosaminidase
MKLTDQVVTWLTVLLSCVNCVHAEALETVIPRPVSYETGTGVCNLSEIHSIVASGGQSATAEYLRSFASSRMGLNLSVKAGASPDSEKCIVLSVVNDPASKNELGAEGYRLKVKADRIIIEACTDAGLFYGIQTMRQLLPPGIEGKEKASAVKWSIPCVTIVDRPRFAWRGFMLDEARHFFGKETVKRVLDQMALLKLNRFHWHLTDNEAWRIEIKQYPKLTETGAIDPMNPNVPPRFYTQDDIREIVKYAAALRIVIIPEIEMPGHAKAAGRAYPELSDNHELNVRYRKRTFNPGKEETYVFLAGVLKEVAGLFPGPWLHFGGDEVDTILWQGLPGVEAMMKAQQCTTLKEVESYFNRRMAGVIESLGRKTCGWDEVTAAGIPSDKIVVFLWRWGDKKLPTLLDDVMEKKYEVVLCPLNPTYFNLLQDSSHTSFTKRWGVNTLDNVLDFPVFPEKWTENERKRILGIHACLWTEKVKTVQKIDYLIFPRLAALSESAWTVPERKSREAFMKRLPLFLQRLDAMGVYYYDPLNPGKNPEPVE